jgi:hypothetical protein
MKLVLLEGGIYSPHVVRSSDAVHIKQQSATVPALERCMIIMYMHKCDR